MSVFPIPGDQVASPQTQIAFRGVPIAGVGNVVVTGSRSGCAHGPVRVGLRPGRAGASCRRSRSCPGEVVTVRTRLHIRGATAAGRSGSRSPRRRGRSRPRRCRRRAGSPATSCTFHSQPGPDARVGGDHQAGSRRRPRRRRHLPHPPAGTDPERPDDPRTRAASWCGSSPLPTGDMAADLRVQRYRGQPVLTWWQGELGGGRRRRRGRDRRLAPTSQIATVHAANGLQRRPARVPAHAAGHRADHRLLPGALERVRRSAGRRARSCSTRSCRRSTSRPAWSLFEWHSLDHVAPSESHTRPVGSPPFDYFHINSIAPTEDGNLIALGAQHLGGLQARPRQRGR